MKINLAGDFVIDNSLSEYTYNDVNVSDSIRNILSNADHTIINLEAPLVKVHSPVAKYGPILSMNINTIELLKRLGIDSVCLANNHIMDHGKQGLSYTLENLRIHKIKWVGAGMSRSDADRPLILQNDGVTVGILNITENEFSISYGEEPGAAPLDVIDNTLSIQELRKQTDAVVLVFHGGAETHNFPSPRIVKLLRYYATQGADAVVSHHTHRFNGYEIYNGKPIVYGLGNFIFPNKYDKSIHWNLGAIATLTIEKEKRIDLTVNPIMLDYSNGIFLRDLNSKEANVFYKHLAQICESLNDENSLQEHYQYYIDNVCSQYKHYLQPYSSKYLHKLYSLGIIPDFLHNKKKRMLYLNLIRCEAHRDVLLDVLSNRY
jgi:poly-gamma-glutamate synthesis protein (capsule biosynthesis protein)